MSNMANLSAVPKTAGSYVFWFRLNTAKRRRIGKLGILVFARGMYAYTGSAMGSGGLRARLFRHCHNQCNKHWHLDYLSRAKIPQTIWFTGYAANAEHRLSDALQNAPGYIGSMPGFGASDCNCSSHLHHFECIPAIAVIRSDLILQELHL
jgi:Uri superfamily endonuclease